MALKNIGALWSPPAGKSYVCSGIVEVGGVKHKVFVFTAKKKTNEKSPDFNIAEQIPDAEMPASEPATVAEVENVFGAAAQPTPASAEPTGSSDGDTPF